MCVHVDEQPLLLQENTLWMVLAESECSRVIRATISLMLLGGIQTHRTGRCEKRILGQYHGLVIRNEKRHRIITCDDKGNIVEQGEQREELPK